MGEKRLRNRAPEASEAAGPAPGRLHAFLGGDPADPAILLPPLLLAVALLAFALVAPIVRIGDASDYVLATESLLHDRDLAYEPADIARHFAVKPTDFVSPKEMTIPGRDGRRYLGLWHSFYYSLLAVPFYALFSYRGFLVLNAVLLFGAAFLLQQHLRRWNGPGAAWAFTLLAVGLSAAPAYLLWIHTETLQLALMAAFMYLWRSGRTSLAGLVLGIAIGGQTSFGVVAPIFLGALLLERRGLVSVALAGALVAAGAAPQLLANLVLGGTLSPMAASGLVGPRHFSFEKLLRGLFDPAFGVLWFYPAVLVALLLAPRNRTTAVGVAAALAILAATTFSSGFVSHQVGLRYGNYVFPVVLFLVEGVRFTGRGVAAGWAFSAFCGAGLLLNPLGNSVPMDPTEKWFLPHRLASSLPFYREDFTVTWTRMVKLGQDFGASPAWSDGWVAGGEPVTLMALGFPRADSIDLTLESWRGEGRAHQLVRVETASGEVREFQLPPNDGRTVTVPLGPGDVVRRSPEALGICVLKLRVPGWVPVETGVSQDYRRLGVRIAGVSVGGRKLF